ncbi:MAG TPA: hypothetical protein VGD63_13290 [Steroidobacteraceae bacterium]
MEETVQSEQHDEDLKAAHDRCDAFRASFGLTDLSSGGVFAGSNGLPGSLG